MNLSLNIDQFNDNYIYYCEPIKNNIIQDGLFIRIIYSTPYFVLNGINFYIYLNDILIEKIHNKYKCSFNINSHKVFLSNIKQIEEHILKNVNITNKIPQFNIYNQLKNGNIKIFTDIEENKKNINLFILKISGIWVTKTHFGITYKFLYP
jgi:hypothetical protein